MFILATILTFAITFLIGSIPWGVVVSRVVYKDDVRRYGSGNIGTTNMIRAFGKPAGYAVFVLDFAKGIVSGFLALGIFRLFVASTMSTHGMVDVAGQALYGSDCKNIMVCASFCACIWGHIFSPFLKLHGGKGIATAVGNEFVSLTPVGAVIELVVFGVFVAWTKYVSAGSIAASIACLPISLVMFWTNPIATGFMWIGAFTVLWAHRDNIGRLRRGEEHRIGSKR